MGIKKNVPNVIHNVKPTPPPILKMEASVIGPSQSGQLNRWVTPLYLPRFPSNKGLARLQHSRQVRASCWQSRNRSTRTVHSGSMGSAVKTLDTNHGDRPARSTRSPLHNLVLTMKGMLPNAFPDHRHPVRKCQWEARKSHNQVFFPPYGHESFWS